MKLQVKQRPGENIAYSMRRLGYSHQFYKEQMAFVRPLETSGYPRFHIYLTQSGNTVTLDLHLDQKQQSYQGSKAHSGEYDGQIVEEEIERINHFFNPQE